MTLPPRSMTRGRSLILATDLDGTFTGGSTQDRERLQSCLSGLPGSMLIYLTGRSIGATRALISEANIPLPDVLIADVGTSVMNGRYFTPVVEVEEEIDRRWPGREAVIERIAGTPGITEQPVWAPRRVSYLLEEGTLEAAITRMRERLAELDVDLVGSADTFIDVLPKDVNKGTTLRRVIRWLGREDDDVVVAGDTLNDLALLLEGFPGVVVGNCTPDLRECVSDLPHCFLAKGEGAAGILEGLSHFGWTEADTR